MSDIKNEKKLAISLVIFNKTVKTTFLKVIKAHPDAEVTTPSNKAESFTLLKDGTTDLLIIDQELEDTDVFSFMDLTKDQIHWDTIPRILLTSDTADISTAKASEYGFEGVVAKPFTQATVESTIDPIIKKYLNPNPETKLLKTLNTHIVQKNYEQAKVELENSKLEVENSDLEYKKAEIYFYLKDFEKSEKILNEIIKKNAEHVKGHLLFAKLKAEQKKYAESYEHIKIVISISPNNKERLSFASELAVRSRNYSDTYSYAQIVDKLEWTDSGLLTYQAAALITQGTFLHNQKKDDEAVEAYALAAKLSLKNPEVKSLGIKALVDGVKIKFVKNLEEVMLTYVKGHEEEPYALFAKGMADFHLKEYSRAHDFFIKLKSHKEWAGQAYCYLLLCLKELGKQDKVQKTIQEAESLGIKSPEFLKAKNEVLGGSSKAAA